MFEKRKIKKLQIEIARLSAVVETLERLIKGTPSVPSYYADKFIEQSGKLAAAKKQLELVCE